jgi:hypothetical protein
MPSSVAVERLANSARQDGLKAHPLAARVHVGFERQEPHRRLQHGIRVYADVVFTGRDIEVAVPTTDPPRTTYLGS